MRRVVVVGAGFAGLAAAWAAERQGADVTLVSSGPGASELSSGALDDAPWERLMAASQVLGERATCPPLIDGIHEFCAALAIYRVPATGEAMPVLATAAGVLRPARGHDRALLDLSHLEPGCVYLARVGRAGWDADAIARTLNDSPIARARGLDFRALDAQVLHQRAEWRIGDTDLATLHDDAARLAWLGARLREALGSQRASGLLLGPWLGSAEPRAEALSTLVGVPVGEALVGVGSPAGFRFAAARERFIEALGLRVVEARVDGIAWDEEQWHVAVGQGEGSHAADAVVLASGGLVGGGVIYRPAEHLGARDLPPRAVVPFQLNVDVEVPMGLRGRRLDPTSSLHGPALDEEAWPRGPRAGALEAAGVLCDGVVVRSDALGRARPLYAAGDVIADRPRAVLQAIASGVLAGARASGER